MSLVNTPLRLVFDALLYPFRELPPLVGLGVVSALTGIAMLWVFKLTSDQTALAAVKRQIHAGLFEIRLYNDDLRAIFRAQRHILRHNLSYLRLSLAPMIWMLAPLLLVVAQLQFHYGYAGLEPGARVVLKAELRTAPGAQDGTPVRPAVSLEAPEGLRVETPAVWIPGLRELAWRIAADRPGDYELRLRVGDAVATKTVRVTGAVVRRSPVRVSGLLDQILYPAESPLPGSSPFRSISVGYPEREIDVFGMGLHWMIVFFVLSIAVAFALRNRLGVTI